MALLYRHSPTFVGNRSWRTDAVTGEPALRICESCALTTVSPAALPMDPPASPPGYFFPTPWSPPPAPMTMPASPMSLPPTPTTPGLVLPPTPMSVPAMPMPLPPTPTTPMFLMPPTPTTMPPSPRSLPPTPWSPPPMLRSAPPSPVLTGSSMSVSHKSEFRSHDHPTLFVRCAGHVAPSATKTRAIQRRGALDAGIGVSFVSGGPESRYDLSEPVPASMAAGDHGVRATAVTPNRAEVFAAIRALDRVKGILAAACRERSNGGGWEEVMGGGKRRMAPGTTLPGKVEEIVVLTRSEYLISSITAPTAKKPWRLTAAGLRRFPVAYFPTSPGYPSPPSVYQPTHHRGASTSSLSSLLGRSSCASQKYERLGQQHPQRTRTLLERKGAKTARKADFDLFFELDLLVEDLASTYGVRVCFHQAVVNEAARLAKRGASREGEESAAGLLPFMPTI